MEKEKQMIILDTDIGDDIDDAFAIAMLMKMPEIELKGITTVYRNCEQRAKIVSKLLQTYNREDIGVYAGVNKPIKQKVFIAPFETVQADGTPNIPHYSEDMNDSTYQDKHAVDFILEMLDQYPGQVVLVAIGPLTNLAYAYMKSPETFKKAKKIVFMGGQIEGTYAEWNIKCDPEAAKIVFESEVPIRIVTLETTRLCDFSEEDIKFVQSIATPQLDLINKMLRKWIIDINGRRPPIMYDPLTVGTLVHDFCKFEKMKVHLSLEGNERAMIRRAKEGEDFTVMDVSVSVRHREFIEYLKMKLLATKKEFIFN